MKKKVFKVVCKIVEYTIYCVGLLAFEYALYKCYTGCWVNGSSDSNCKCVDVCVRN